MSERAPQGRPSVPAPTSKGGRTFRSARPCTRVRRRLVEVEEVVLVVRTRDLPLILAAQGSRFYMMQKSPFPKVVVVELAR
jgi:hypothetical protein